MSSGGCSRLHERVPGGFQTAWSHLLQGFLLCASKKWVMVADLASLIFLSKETIHVCSAKIFPAMVGDKLLVKTSNRLFHSTMLAGLRLGWGGCCLPPPLTRTKDMCIHLVHTEAAE